MATAVLFLGLESSGGGSRGRGVQVPGGEALEILGKFQTQGYFERYDRIALTPHCGTTNGFLLLHGERAKLDELRRTDEFEHFSISLLRFFEGYGVVPGLNGEALDKAMARNRDLMRVATIVTGAPARLARHAGSHRSRPAAAPHVAIGRALRPADRRGDRRLLPVPPLRPRPGGACADRRRGVVRQGRRQAEVRRAGARAAGAGRGHRHRARARQPVRQAQPAARHRRGARRHPARPVAARPHGPVGVRVRAAATASRRSCRCSRRSA